MEQIFYAFRPLLVTVAVIILFSVMGPLIFEDCDLDRGDCGTSWYFAVLFGLGSIVAFWGSIIYAILKLIKLALNQFSTRTKIPKHK
jgi:hypothetical protein